MIFKNFEKIENFKISKILIFNRISYSKKSKKFSIFLENFQNFRKIVIFSKYFQSLRKFGKWEMPKKLWGMQGRLCLSGWNRSGVNRWPGGRAIPGKRPRRPRKPRVLRIGLAGSPIFDLARSGLQGPRVCPAQRGTMALVDTSTLVHTGAPRGKPPVSW